MAVPETWQRRVTSRATCSTLTQIIPHSSRAQLTGHGNSGRPGLFSMPMRLSTASPDLALLELPGRAAQMARTLTVQPDVTERAAQHSLPAYCPASPISLSAHARAVSRSPTWLQQQPSPART